MKSEIEHIDDFIADSTVNAASARQYTFNLKRWYRWLRQQGIDYSTFKRKDIIAYMKELQAAGYSTLTVASYIQTIKLLVRWLKANNMMSYDVANEIRVNKEYNTFRKSSLSPSQVDQLLQIIPRDRLLNKRDFAIVYLMLTTGIRVVEVTRLLVSDLQHTDEYGYYLQVQRKGRQTRQPMPISKQCFEIIQEYLTSRNAYTNNHPLFATHANRCLPNSHLSTKVISDTVKGYMDAIGCKGSMYTAHSLRHTAATMILSIEGSEDSDLQRFLSHSNYQTSQLYIEQQKQSELFRKRFTDKISDRLNVSI